MESQFNELIDLSKKGDREAYARLYDMFVGKIYGYIFYRTYHKETAEDLTSRTFLKALEKFYQYKASRGSFSAWLFRIAHNQIIDHYRKNKKTANIDDIWDLKSTDDVEQAAVNKEQIQRVKALLKELKPIQREIVLLRVWQDLPYQEIAEIVGKSEANCKMMFSRTLIRLRHDLSIAVVLIMLFHNKF